MQKRKITNKFREMRRRIQTGKIPSLETRKKMSESHKGKTRSAEYRKNISESKKGFKNPMFGKHFTDEAKRKQSEQRKGSKSHRWRGGISHSNKRIRMSLESRLWRKAVFERDHQQCVWCGSSKRIQADHIQLFSTHPELRFAIDNGRTLCYLCHRKRHKKCLKKTSI